MTDRRSQADGLLCRLEDIKDGQARGFTVERQGSAFDVFVVRRGSRVFGYRNWCPHTARRLDWFPDEFMDEKRGHIACSSHGALFRVEDGACVAGPCLGESLKPVPVRVDEDGRVVLAS